MSLKAVHLIFVSALSALAFGCGVWKLKDHLSPEGTSGDLLFSLAAFVAGLLVIGYGIYFLKKMKAVSYL